MTETTQAELWQELETRFKALKDAYKRLDGEADQRITRWRYAEESAFDLHADYFRRSNEQPGKLVDEEPSAAYTFHAYGYDAQDRIIYAASFQMEADPRVSTFYDYRPDGSVDLAEYLRELHTMRYSLSRVARLVQPPGGKPLHYVDYGAQEGRAIQTFETYHYDNLGRMERVTTVQRSEPRSFSEKAKQGLQRGMDQQRRLAQMLGTEEQFEKTFPQFEQLVEGMLNHRVHIETEATYEYAGETLQRIVSRSVDTAGAASQPQERILYEAPVPGESDENQFEAARASLRAAVLKHIQEFDPARRQQTLYYNLVLSYDAVADEGVSLALGQEAQRQAWEKETDEISYASLTTHLLNWTYQSGGQPYQNYIVISELPRAYQRFLDRTRRDKQWDVVRDLLNRVARDLNDHDWSGVLKTSDDFIVYASDYEALEQVEDEIAVCVPEHKIQILREKGLLD